MKKAIVLGVMAFFAINIATVQNVKAQDRKKVTTTETVDVKETKPAQNNQGKLSTDKKENTTKGDRTAQPDKKNQPIQVKEKPTDPKINTVETEKKASNGKKVDTKVAKDIQNKNVAGKDKNVVKENPTVEKDNTKKDVKKETKSVPPTPKEKQKVTGNSNNTQR